MGSVKRTLLVSLSMLSSLSFTATAQCPTPDGLDGGPCCTTVVPNLPDQRNFVQDAFDICWRDCDVDSFRTCRAEWKKALTKVVPGQTLPGPCDPRVYTVKLRDPLTGKLKWIGKKMRATYSRTWLETDSTGANYQVWRFLVNGDMKPRNSAGLSPCPVPPCASQFQNRVRFTGYMDYARNCTTNTFSYAWMLTHACDVVDHAPNFGRAGFFHPNRAYTFVGPSAGFAIGPIQPTESGGTSLEGVRRLRLPPAAGGQTMCEYEEQIDCGLDVLQELCLCGSPLSPMQWVISDLGLASSCATSIFAPGGPFLPGFMSMGLGAWTDPTKYPGLETLRWSTGGYDYFDPCVGVTSQEVFFGVSTLGGYFASAVNSFGVGLPLPLIFIDQANSLRSGSTTMNLPYVSDHVLNLNF